MSERGRNIAVGTTVLVALCMLAGMIVIFTGIPSMFRRGYVMSISFDNTQGAKEGDPVRIAGRRIGSITGVRFAQDDNAGAGIVFTVLIDAEVRIPGNANAYLHTKGLTSPAHIEFRPDGPQRKDPATGEILVTFPTDRVTTLNGKKARDGGLIPPEVVQVIPDLRDSAKKMGELAASLNETLPHLSRNFAKIGRLAETIDDVLKPVAASSQPTSRPKSSLVGALEAIARFGPALEDLHRLLGDKQNQANFSKALAEGAEAMTAVKDLAHEARTSVRSVTRTSTVTAQRIEKVADTLIGNAEKVSAVMTTLNRALVKMESGKGSAGKLLNDPKLYDDLVDATDQLSKLMADLRTLIKTWKAEGVGIRLK